MGDGAGDEGSKPVPFSFRALILGVSAGARGHVSLISSVVRVWGLAGSSTVELSGKDVVKMAAHSVLLLINLEGGVKAGRGGWGVAKRRREKKRRQKAVQFTLITTYVLSIAFIVLCGAHTYAKLIAQEVK